MLYGVGYMKQSDYCKCCQKSMNKTEIMALPFGSWGRWFFSYFFKACMKGAIWYSRRRLSAFKETPMGKLPPDLERDAQIIKESVEKTHKGYVSADIDTVVRTTFLFLHVDNAYHMIWKNIKEGIKND